MSSPQKASAREFDGGCMPPPYRCDAGGRIYLKALGGAMQRSAEARDAKSMRYSAAGDENKTGRGPARQVPQAIRGENGLKERSALFLFGGLL
jgi:hypothetical protein